MEVYEVTGPDGGSELFKNWGDIERTLRISYSACTSLDVMKSPGIVGVSFTVTGFLPLEKFDDPDKPFEHVFKVKRRTVIEGPTHL